MHEYEQAVWRSISMYPTQWAVVFKLAASHEGKVSRALRQIVDDWARQREEEEKSDG